MAVVTKYGTGYPDPTSKVQIDADKAEAHVKALISQVSITNGDSIASKFFVGRVPTNCFIDPASLVTYEAVAGVTDADLGVFYPAGGAVIDVDALIDGASLATAGSTTLQAAASGAAVLANPANQAKRLWELVGLSADPGGFFDLVLTLNAAATATKVANFFIKFGRKI